MPDARGVPEPATSLQVRRRPRIATVAWALALVVVAAVLAWVATHPSDLPTSTRTVRASTPVGQPVFVGVFSAPGDFDRELHLAGVKIFATSTAGDVEITPHLCRGGSVAVTTDPAPFCSELDGTEGTSMGAGDEIVLEVSAAMPGAVAIHRIRVAFRDGLQWGTKDAGSPALVTLIPREP